MDKYGILIDFDWCTGCHSCEMACQVEYNFPIGQNGIVVQEIGPWRISDDVWQYTYIPIPTDLCSLCESRTHEGKLPTCVAHCQAKCMEFGTIENLSEKLKHHSKQVLFALD